jgi:hypothetical protein
VNFSSRRHHHPFLPAFEECGFYTVDSYDPRPRESAYVLCIVLCDFIHETANQQPTLNTSIANKMGIEQEIREKAS